jgi:putative transposase
MVVEGALEGELDDHLGYEKNDPAGRNGGNSRNGHRGKTVFTEAGPGEISMPRDRDSSFEPKIVAKRQQRLTGVEDMVISLSARGLTHGEIAAHLAEVYGAEVSKQTITAITDAVMDRMADWQNRPLDAGCLPCCHQRSGRPHRRTPAPPRGRKRGRRCHRDHPGVHH